MKAALLRTNLFPIALLLFVGVGAGVGLITNHNGIGEEVGGHSVHQIEERVMKVQYLEIVTSKVDETCASLAEAHGVVFGEPIMELGNARTADLADGGRVGVRAPMRETEAPVVRPYLLVDDIEAAVEVAKKAGAEVAIPPMEIPGQGTFSIYILGGIEHGLWEN